MNKDKQIWEALGYCIHSFYPENDSRCGFCRHCHVHKLAINSNERTIPDFTTDAGKVLLLREMMGRGDCVEFITLLNHYHAYLNEDPIDDLIEVDLITDKTGKFRDAVYEYLRGRGEIK